MSQQQPEQPADVSEIIRQRKMDQIKNALGSTVLSYLEDKDIIEIMLNPDGKVWIDSLSKGQMYTGYNMRPQDALAFLNTVATYLETEFSYESSILEGELPLDGSRIEGLRPPTTEAPSFSIRKKASAVFPLETYVQQGKLSVDNEKYIEKAILERKNFVVVGSTGAGKTTLGNAIIKKISELTPDDRIVLIEDTLELQSVQKNMVSMRTGKNKTMQQCVMATLRYRPDRIIIGEVRNYAALELIKAWNTGHPGGLTTVHADSGAMALHKIELYIAEKYIGPMQETIGEAVDVIIFIEKTPKGRMISEIIEVDGYDTQKQEYRLNYILRKQSKHMSGEEHCA